MTIEFVMAYSGLVLIPAFWLLYQLASPLGGASRERKRAKFKKALLDDRRKVWVGLVPWVIAEHEFRPVVGDAGSRGMTYDGEQSRSRRRAREIEASVDRTARHYGILGATSIFALLAMFWHEGAGLWVYIMTPFLLWNVFRQFLYQFGFQAMSGAMVLDPELGYLDRSEVYSQMVHGDSAVAPEVISVAAARGGLRRSPAHKQEF